MLSGLETFIVMSENLNSIIGLPSVKLPSIISLAFSATKWYWVNQNPSRIVFALPSGKGDDTQ